jgi:hypothetical protein
LDPDSIAACVSELVARPEVSGLAAQHAREQGVRLKPESVAGRIAGIIEDAALRGQPDTPKVERECVDALLAPYLLPEVAGAYEAMLTCDHQPLS